MKLNSVLGAVRQFAPALVVASMMTAGSLAISAPAHALAKDCEGSYSALVGDVDPSIGCNYSDSANQDYLNTDPLTVNAEAFFGKTDWIYSSKFDFDENQYEQIIDLDFTITGNSAEGNWSIAANAFDLYSDIMLIFKSGNGTTLVGYQLNSTSGSYVTPFTEPPFEFSGNTTEKDISHISVYVRDKGPDTPPQSVPEPAAMLGLGVVGVGLVSQCLRKSAAQA